MEARWEQFRADVHNILREQDRMLRIKLEENQASRRTLAQEDELHELQREEIRTNFASIANKKEAVMRGEPVDVDEVDPLRLSTRKRRRSMFGIGSEPGQQSAGHDTGPSQSVVRSADDLNEEVNDNNGAKDASGIPQSNHSRGPTVDLERIHDKFPTVIRLDGVWVEVSCAVCGANESKWGVFKSLVSFRTHHTSRHPLVHFTGLGFCTRRVVSDTDVQKMKEGREPEVPIVVKKSWVQSQAQTIQF
ncbi:hypothetical protein CERZMDRAFT_102159 [Cercospora zeae-maydis SCOH1-5]|uniref:Uncharacterized protein n=1 Tax=Cercospora zeae-maydis SCOH1-5 TaxID=717836 RepID=A0A6A6F1M4_9PEZI|nr:hypothetical protein CERZMDRAFT_102159 [Cercospora zeae-maydis SCOH1-5]